MACRAYTHVCNTCNTALLSLGAEQVVPGCDFVCPHTTIYVSSSYYVSSYYYICVLILLYTCPHIIYMCPQATVYVLILLYMCPHARDAAMCPHACITSYYICVLELGAEQVPACYSVSSCHWICVLMPLDMPSLILLYMCP